MVVSEQEIKIAHESHESVWRATLSVAQQSELAQLGSGVLSSECDVLVIGGGIVGLTTAYFLAERGQRVQVIDAGEFAHAATNANLGGVWPNDLGPAHPPTYQPLAFLGRDLWGRMSLRPDFDFDWRVNGFLNVNPARFPPSANEFARQVHELGYTVAAVDGEQIAGLEPQLATGWTQGLHYPAEAHVHPVKGALSFARAGRKKGVNFSAGTCALRVLTDDGQATGVETNRGVIAAKQIVAATAWQADYLRDVVTIDLPLRPVSGQLLATGPVPRLLKSVVANRFLMAQLKSGEIITGGNVVEGVQTEPDIEVTRQMISHARELIPALSDVPFVRAWCGVRPATTDGLPIVDRVPGCENLWLNCGHYRSGILLAPATGKLLADWLTTGGCPEELVACAVSRFG